MTKNNIVLSLDDAGEDRYICGGKFVGLYDLKYLLNQYNIRYKTNFVIPSTYAIPTPYFDDYKRNGGVPDHIVKAAMECANKIGGNVAVRSSADVEDRPGKTYSGQFESVLNVKTRAQMVEALNTVYASAANVPGAQMGVILQSMVPNPKMAGVAYSETWYRGSWVVLNYTENEYADKILSDKNAPSTRFATFKAVCDATDFIGEENLWGLNLWSLNNPAYDIRYWHEHNTGFATPWERIQYKNQFLISALTCELENTFGYPIDMEFVVDGNNVINIVQQRPYMLPKFHKIDIDSCTTSIFSPEKPILEGTVGFVDSLHVSPGKTRNNFDLYIYKKEEYDLVHIFTKNSVGVAQNFEFGNESRNPIEAQFNHFGNMSRENLDFTDLEMWHRVHEFKDIKPGDRIRVNFLTAQVEKIR